MAGADTLIGGDGNDTYVVDNALDTVTETNALAAGGVDLVQVAIATAGLPGNPYVLGANIENAILTNRVAYSLTGNELDNVLTGNAAINTLIGALGNDTLDGAGGVDYLDGGAGDDTYIVDVAGDSITDSAGTDTVIAKLASGSYVLASGLENLTLFGSAAINGTGNAADNTITGNDGANTLDGGAGADTLVGGKGKDIYLVDDLGDIVQESTVLASEIDLVKVNIVGAGGNYTLGSNLEYATLINAVAYDLTGNTLSNTLTGNGAANVLDGGAGVDKLLGGAGNDTYIVDLTAAGGLQDTITETSTSDTGDTLQLRGTSTNVVAATLTLATTLENLDASATAGSKLNLTGNAAANNLTGNDAANVLNGMAGADTLIGGLGNDTLTGGLGDDVFRFDNLPISTGTNTDTITDFSKVTGNADRIYLDHVIFDQLGAGGSPLDATAFITGSAATDDTDRIIYNQTTGALYYDSDGSGIAAMVQLAIFGTTTHPSLVATDFFVS